MVAFASASSARISAIGSAGSARAEVASTSVGPCWILASESWDSRRSPTSLHIFAKCFFQSYTPTFAAL
eukprot:496022-Prymnesium_polylepis.1